jgi:hypothetical protein
MVANPREEPMKTAVLAGLVALTAAAVVAAPAQAATVKQVTSSCRSGDFGGTLTLRYETSGGSFHPIGAITTSGPYIGDSGGTLLLRIYYREGVSTHTVYTRSTPTTGSTSETLPSGLSVPVTARGNASATFDNGVTSCVATVPIS